MRISQDTLVMLARSGDEQAIEVLKAVENETRSYLLEVEYHFQPGPGLFHSAPLDSRKRTVMGMPAFTKERLAELTAR